MILQELNKYYERLLADPDCEVPPRHWSTEKAAWELRLSSEGKLLGAYQLTQGEGKKLRKFISLRVPEHTTRTVGISPFFLCDNPAYLLGYDEKSGPEKLASARALHEGVLAGCDDEGAQAVLHFFESEDRDADLGDAVRAELAEIGGFAVFRLQGDKRLLHDRPAVVAAWAAYCDDQAKESVMGQCSVTGVKAPLARLFPQVSGVPGAQSAGASLVSFNFNSSESYGKSQTYNASVSEEVAFNAGSVLRQLYADPEHRVRIGETTVVFWADRPAQIEDKVVLAMLDPDELDRATEDTFAVESVRAALESMERGLPLQGVDVDTRYFVLGLAPNAARLSVRFFETSTFGRMAEKFGEYLRDVSMTGVRTRSLRALLLQTAPMGASDQLPSTLVNSCMEAMLTGHTFPQALYYAVLSRMRSDHACRNAWDMGQRAALLKACLLRKERLMLRDSAGENGVSHLNKERSLKVDLDKKRTNRGYVLGRLFAVMEHTQKSALGEVNATIRDRYIGAASTTPARVFPHLLHTTQNHLSKLRKSNPGLCIKFEKANDEIMGMLDGASLFPKTLGADDQGEFFVGYYQQRVDLWKKHSDEVDETSEASDTTENN